MTKPTVYAECKIARYYWDDLVKMSSEKESHTMVENWEEMHVVVCENCHNREREENGNTKRSHNNINSRTVRSPQG